MAQTTLTTYGDNYEYQPRQVSDAERAVVRDVLQEFSQYQVWRNVFAGQWEEAAQLVDPVSRNTFFYGSYNWPGQKKTDRQVDVSGAKALHRFCAIADSLVTPRTMFWHGLENEADYIMKDRRALEWYESTTRTLFKQRYALQANFTAQNYAGWRSLGAYGNSTIFTDTFDGRQFGGSIGFRYRAVPLGETFYGENHQGRVDRLIRWFRLTAYQAMQKWGIERLPQALISALKENSQYPYNFLHCVRPRHDYDPERLDVRRMPFSSYYVAIEGQCLMAPEGGYRVFPFAVRRYEQGPNEVYGRGPAQIVLPSLKTLNAQKTVFLKQGHRAADPVLLMADDGIVGMDLRPGAQNKGGVDQQGRELVKTLPTGNIQINIEMMDRERADIDDTFLTSIMQTLVENPNMTATQVVQIAAERGMLVAPTLGRQHEEYVGQLVERELDLAAQMRMIAPPPDIVREAREHYRVKDTSPLALTARANEAAGFMRLVDWLGDIAVKTGDISVFDRLDFDEAVPDLAAINNVPIRYVVTDRQLADKRKQRAAAQQREQQIKELPSLAAMKKADAVQFKAGMQPNQQAAPALPVGAA